MCSVCGTNDAFGGSFRLPKLGFERAEGKLCGFGPCSLLLAQHKHSDGLVAALNVSKAVLPLGLAFCCSFLAPSSC